MALFTTAVKSLVEFAKAFSISKIALLTLVMAESASGKSTALARYSPISADSLANFLRSSSVFLAVASVVTVAAIAVVAVVATSACMELMVSTLEIAFARLTLPSSVGESVSA